MSLLWKVKVICDALIVIFTGELDTAQTPTSQCLLFPVRIIIHRKMIYVLSISLFVILSQLWCRL